MQAYEQDRPLMEELGLDWRTPFERDWTDLGAVTVEEAATDNEYNSLTGPRPASTVGVEVCAMPAQFWRFTITRPQDATCDDPDAPNGFRAVYEPVERFVLRTGSGLFSTFWPFAESVARHMVNIERVAA